MTTLALFLATALAPDLTLSAGSPTDSSLAYWACEDTFLDQSLPEENYGRDSLLSGGPGKTILIRFGDLARVTPAGKRIKSAALVFSVELGETNQKGTISTVLGPWLEGPGRRGLRPALRDGELPAPVLASSWKTRFGGPGPIGWQRAGSTGPSDIRPVEGAQWSGSDTELRIDGLGPAVEQMRQRWWENYGFALEFGQSIDFSSTESMGAKPRLELQFEDAKADGQDLAITTLTATPQGGQTVWTATILNRSASEVSGAPMRFFERGKLVGESRLGSIAAGGTTTATITLPDRRKAPNQRLWPLVAEVESPSGDRQPTDNAVAIDEAATPIKLDRARVVAARSRDRWLSDDPQIAGQQIVQLFNETVAQHSRFSYAPDGLLVTWRFDGFLDDNASPRSNGSARDVLAAAVRSQLPAPWKDVDGTSEIYPGLTGMGDTRDDSAFPRSLSLTYEPWADPVMASAPFPATDLLSNIEVLALGGINGKPVDKLAPATTLLRVLYADGQSIANKPLQLFPLEEGLRPKADYKTGPQGTILLPMTGDKSPFVGSATLVGSLTAGDATERFLVRPWEPIVAAARAGGSIAMLNKRVALPDGKLNMGTNLALGKLVDQSAGESPTLAKLVDGDAGSGLETNLKVGEWIEIDLGRDRLVGDVTLTFASASVWPKFDIMVYTTGQRAAEAFRWMSEIDGTRSLALRGVGSGPTSIAYRGAGTRARYIRVVVRSAAGSSVSLNEIAVHPLIDE